MVSNYRAFTVIFVLSLILWSCSDNQNGSLNNIDSSDMSTGDSSKIVPSDTSSDTSEKKDLTDEEEILPENSALLGSAVKGPFAHKSVVVIYGINKNGSRTRSIKKVWTNSRGQLISTPISYNGWIEIEVTGFYFDELTGKQSEIERTLTMVGRVVDKKLEGNINLFTSFEAARIRELFGSGISPTVKLAQDRVRAEFSRIFYIGSYPSELSILNTGSAGLDNDNAILLWFSAATLKAKVTQEEYEIMVTDFAEDGKIDMDGVPILERIKGVATREIYETARAKLFTEYGAAPPRLDMVPLGAYWLFTRCYSPIVLRHTKVCLGDNPDRDFLLRPEETTEFSFFAPYDGSFTLSARFYQVHNFNNWNLTDTSGAIVAQGRKNENWAKTTNILKGGNEYILSVMNRTIELSKFDIEIEPSSQGSERIPLPLLYDVKQKGVIGLDVSGRGDPIDSYYVFHTTKTRPYTFLFSGLSSEIEVTIYYGSRYGESAEEMFNDPEKIIKTGNGSRRVELKVPSQFGTFFIRVHNPKLSVPNDGTQGGMSFDMRIF